MLFLLNLNLLKYPEKFDEAKSYEKLARDHESPFTWAEGEALEDLEKPERIEKIKSKYLQLEYAEKYYGEVNDIDENDLIQKVATCVNNFYTSDRFKWILKNWGAHLCI